MAQTYGCRLGGGQELRIFATTMDQADKTLLEDVSTSSESSYCSTCCWTESDSLYSYSSLSEEDSTDQEDVLRYRLINATQERQDKTDGHFIYRVNNKDFVLPNVDQLFSSVRCTLCSQRLPYRFESNGYSNLHMQSSSRPTADVLQNVLALNEFMKLASSNHRNPTTKSDIRPLSARTPIVSTSSDLEEDFDDINGFSKLNIRSFDDNSINTPNTNRIIGDDYGLKIPYDHKRGRSYDSTLSSSKRNSKMKLLSYDDNHENNDLKLSDEKALIIKDLDDEAVQLYSESRRNNVSLLSKSLQNNNGDLVRNSRRRHSIGSLSNLNDVSEKYLLPWIRTNNSLDKDVLVNDVTNHNNKEDKEKMIVYSKNLKRRQDSTSSINNIVNRSKYFIALDIAWKRANEIAKLTNDKKLISFLTNSNLSDENHNDVFNQSTLSFLNKLKENESNKDIKLDKFLLRLSNIFNSKSIKKQKQNVYKNGNNNSVMISPTKLKNDNIYDKDTKNNNSMVVHTEPINKYHDLYENWNFAHSLLILPSTPVRLALEAPKTNNKEQRINGMDIDIDTESDGIASEKEDDGLVSSLLNDGYYHRFFIEKRKLGKGQRGSVFLCKHSLGGIDLGYYAVKKIPIGDSKIWLKRMLDEVKLMVKLRHNNIVQYRHAWLEQGSLSRFSPKVPCLYILMELANGGSLEDYILQKSSSSTNNKIIGLNPVRNLSIYEIWQLFLDVIEGLNHLHENGILHRDLKPQNLLLVFDKVNHHISNDQYQDNNNLHHRHHHHHHHHHNHHHHHHHHNSKDNIDTSKHSKHSRAKSKNIDWKNTNYIYDDSKNKILVPRIIVSDFGESLDKSTFKNRNDKVNYERTGNTGTVDFCAPELFQTDNNNNNKYIHDHTEKSDIWSLGVILYLLCYNRVPWIHSYINVDQMIDLKKNIEDFNRINKNNNNIKIVNCNDFRDDYLEDDVEKLINEIKQFKKSIIIPNDEHNINNKWFDIYHYDNKNDSNYIYLPSKQPDEYLKCFNHKENEINNKISLRLRKEISLLLEKDPLLRPTSDEVLFRCLKYRTKADLS